MTKDLQTALDAVTNDNGSTTSEVQFRLLRIQWDHGKSLAVRGNGEIELGLEGKPRLAGKLHRRALDVKRIAVIDPRDADELVAESMALVREIAWVLAHDAEEDLAAEKPHPTLRKILLREDRPGGFHVDYTVGEEKWRVLVKWMGGLHAELIDRRRDADVLGQWQGHADRVGWPIANVNGRRLTAGEASHEAIRHVVPALAQARKIMEA